MMKGSPSLRRSKGCNRPINILIGNMQMDNCSDCRDISVIYSLFEIEDIHSLSSQLVDQNLRRALLSVDVYHVGLHRSKVD